MDIRRSTQTDHQAIRNLWEATFTEDGPSFVDHYFNTYKNIEDIIVAYDKDALVGMVHLNPYQIMWRHKLYFSNYVVGVATHQEYRRQGIMRQMLQYVLKEAYEHGEVLQLLMPIDSRYYEQFGYGFVQDMIAYSFKYDSLNRKPAMFPVQELNIDDGAALMGIYHIYKQQLDLNHNRGLRAFNLLLEEMASEGAKAYTVPDGYCLVYDMGEEIFVREAVYNSPDGLMNLIDTVGNIAKGKMIKWQTHTEDPIEHIIPHMVGHKRELIPFMMIRIINVRSFLEDMSMYLDGLILRVTDPVIMENNGIFKVNDGCVERVNDDPHITTDITSLSQWLFGYTSLEKLSYVKTTVSIHKEHLAEILPSVNCFNEYV